MGGGGAALRGYSKFRDLCGGASPRSVGRGQPLPQRLATPTAEATPTRGGAELAVEATPTLEATPTHPLATPPSREAPPGGGRTTAAAPWGRGFEPRLRLLSPPPEPPPPQPQPPQFRLLWCPMEAAPTPPCCLSSFYSRFGPLRGGGGGQKGA